jgi:hypothetical protein
MPLQVQTQSYNSEVAVRFRADIAHRIFLDFGVVEEIQSVWPKWIKLDQEEKTMIVRNPFVLLASPTGFEPVLPP